MSDQRLQAYVDGQASDEERREFEALLALDPALAARARTYREQNDALHALFDPVLQEPHGLRVPVDDRARWQRWGGAAATLLLGVTLGYFARGWLALQSPAVMPIVREAALAHAAYMPEVRHPVEVAASEEQHLVAWLSKRLATPLKAPSLAAAGYRLLGGRLLPPTQAGDPAPLALLMYENAEGRRLSLLIKRESSSSETAFRYADDQGARVFYWVDGPLGYALAGDVPKEELQTIARLVYQQLNP
jgi:anti-sigma factor RsiW